MLQLNLIYNYILALIHFHAPRSNYRGYIVFVLSVCLSVFNFNFRFNFLTVRDKRLHILHAYSTNDALSNDTNVSDLVTLTSTLKLIIAF